MRGRALECVTKRFLARQHRDVPVFRCCGIRSCRPDGLGTRTKATDPALAGGDGRTRSVRGEALSRRRIKRIVGNTITRNPHSKETPICLKIIYLNSFQRFW